MRSDTVKCVRCWFACACLLVWVSLFVDERFVVGVLHFHCQFHTCAFYWWYLTSIQTARSVWVRKKERERARSLVATNIFMLHSQHIALLSIQHFVNVFFFMQQQWKWCALADGNGNDRASLLSYCIMILSERVCALCILWLAYGFWLP